MNKALIGLYIHWPFCEKKCPYCDFNSHVVRQALDQKAYKAALLKEFRYFAERFGPRTIKTIFFGGGTPSLMHPEICQEILEEIAAIWPVSQNAEITLEANPSSAEVKRFQAYRQAGVNRLSLGIQALDNKSLAFLGRIHSAEEALNALSFGREIFDRFSFDLIYARPDQTKKAWAQELQQALALSKGHLSLYQLTLEKGTAFYKLYQKGELSNMADEEALALYQITEDILEAYNMPAYEISNFAIKGQESQHNLIYWRYQDYLGLGPGAHSRVQDRLGNRAAFSTIYQPENWQNSIFKKGHALKQYEILSPQVQGEEQLLMGLRLREAFDLKRYKDLAKKDLSPHAIEKLIEEGLLIKLPLNKIQVTKKGYMVLNYILLTLFVD